MSFPRLIVFDFHKTISLDKKDLNRLLGPYKIDYRENIQPTGSLTVDSWYQIFSGNNIDLDLIIPTWRELIQFISRVKTVRPDVIFAIASMIENDYIILGMMKYLFDIVQIENPFNSDTVVASLTFNKYGFMNLPGKQQHIMVITTNLGLQDQITIGETVLIDDSEKNIINTAPICGILASDYFKISDWNKAQDSLDLPGCNYSKIN